MQVEGDPRAVEIEIHKHEISELRNLVIDRTKQAQALAEEVRKWSSQAGALQQNLDERTHYSEMLAKELLKWSRQAEVLQRHLQERTQVAEALTQRLEEHSAALESGWQSVRDVTVKAQMFENEALARRTELIETRAQLAERTIQAEALAAELAKRTAELVTERELVRERTLQAEQLVALMRAPFSETVGDGDRQPTISCTGIVSKDFEVIDDYDRVVTLPTPYRQIWPVEESGIDLLIAFHAKDILISGAYIPIDIEKNRLIINHTYNDIGRDFPIRINLYRDRFSLITKNYDYIDSDTVVIGGPIDENWYHWLFSWSVRLYIVKLLKPELLSRKDVKFIVHPLAMKQPFRAALDTFGISEQRLLSLDASKDYLLASAELISFPDQSKIYPELIAGFRQHLIEGLGVKPRSSPPRRLFLSRQGLASTRRRVANFDAMKPMLDQMGFEILELGSMSALEQAQAFQDAEIVLGGHGSDFAGMMFCNVGTTVVVLESADSIARHRDRGLRVISDVLKLRYIIHEVGVHYDLAADHRDPHARTNQDYQVDVEALSYVLAGLLDESLSS